MCGHNMTTKFPPDFHNYAELNWLVNFFLKFTIAQLNKLILGCKPRWSTKREKSIILEVVAKRCSAKKLSWKFHKNYREIPVLESLSKEAVVQRCSVKGVFLKISQNSQENTCVIVSFLRTPSPTEHLQWMLLFLILKCVQAVRLATLLKTDPSTGVSEPAICTFSTK